MKKVISILSIIFISFGVTLQSLALVVPVNPSDNEKTIYAKGIAVYKNELTKTNDGKNLVESIDKIIKKYEDNKQVSIYLVNKTNELVAEQKNKKVQDILIYLGFNANYNLAKLNELDGTLANSSTGSTLNGITIGPDGRLYYNGQLRLGNSGGGSSSSSSSGGGGNSDNPPPTSCLDDSKLPTPKPIANAKPENPDEWFYNYRLENFAPSTESSIKQLFGDKLIFENKAFWEYNSYNSHSVGFSTNLPSITIIEYGETNCYGKKTTISDSYYYNHLHYITGLEEGKTYHYRIKAQDYDGNLIVSQDYTFTTKTFTNDVVKVTNEWLENAVATIQDNGIDRIINHQITESGTYVFVEDIVSDTLGINIKASNVTIDLNGHTLIYDNGIPKANPGQAGRQYIEDASMGIRAGLWNFVNFRIYNGVIKQGKNGGAGLYPLFLYHMGSGTQNEVAGITIDYYADSTPGMITGDGKTHHNVVYDRGFVIADRHMGIRAISAGKGSVEYNSLRRFRHRGIDSGEGSQVIGNELYSDSYDTNSFALGLGNGVTAVDNKIFGMGYLPIGIGWGSNTYVVNNFIYERCYSPNQRSDEYARSSSVSGMRVTNYDNSELKNMIYENNTIILKAENGCYMARGIWTTNGVQDSNIVYKNNTIKVEAMPGNVTKTGSVYYNGEVNNAIAAVTVQGNGPTSEEVPNAIIFENNHFLGNVNLVIIGEGYGISSGVRFYNNTLEKIESESEYFRPIRLGFWYWNTLDNKMIDNKLVNINESEMIPHFFGGTGKMEMTYGISKTLTFVDENNIPLANKTIVVSVNSGAIIGENIVTDNQGKAKFELLTSKHSKIGDSLENGGTPGTPANIYYVNYSFSEGSNKSGDIDIEELKGLDKVVLSGG